ncbi:MAG: ComF family protein, partial [Chloroflexi bacterium]|nr:ComF family protein [Chloroflexota bacterium]
MPGISLAYAFYRSIWAGLDILFPPLCGGCDKAGSRWCGNCQQCIQILEGDLCEVCGLPLERASTRVCSACREDRPHFHTLRSWAVFDDPIRKALHKLKYRRNIGLGDALAVHMTHFVKELNWDADMIVPVPLGRGRQRERGYNQVGMIAKPLAMSLGLEFRPKT